MQYGKLLRMGIGNMTKVRLKMIMKEMLERYEDHECLNERDTDICMGLLVYHSEYAAKVGSGVCYIFPAPGHTTRCFWIRRTDDTETDWSFHHCIRNKPSNRTRKGQPKLPQYEVDMIAAMRSAVRPQIEDFRRETGAYKMHIDHVEPFSNLVAEYVNKYGKLEVVPTIDGECGCRLVHPEHWQHWHKSHATLTALTPLENMRKGKKREAGMTPQHFTPREYQDTILDHILQTPRCAIYAGMGMGKTISTLTALDILQLTEPGKVLVLAPLRVASSTWPDEALKWDHLKHTKVVAVVGTAAARRAALQIDASIYATNYENLPWLVEHFGEDWPFKTVVADESTRLKGFRLRQGGVRARALGRIAHTKIDRFIQLTGTPSPNGLVDLWGQMYFIDKGQRLGRSFRAFTSRWFQSIQVGADRNAVKLEPMPHAQLEIEDRLRDVCLSLDARDYFNIDEPIVTVINVDLPPKARRTYQEMEKEMFIELECGTEIEAFNAASKTIKCLQLANGAIYTDDTRSKWTETHDAKLQALESIVAEASGMPVLVAYHFKSDLTRLQKAFPRGRQLDKDPQTIRDWNAGKIPVLFAHPASAGHGLNLQDGGNIIAFFGHWWNLEEYQQIIERIGPTRQAQAGHKRPVFIYHIIATNTVDELVMARRESKREVQELLLEAMKRRDHAPKINVNR